MKTANEKAKEIIERYCTVQLGENEYGETMRMGDWPDKAEAKICALIAINEIINAFEVFELTRSAFDSVTQYWRDVISEIEKL